MSVSNCTMIEGLDYRTGKPIAVEIEAGTIVDIRENHAQNTTSFIGPGLVDLQVNGFRGTDFNRMPLSSQDVAQVTQVLWQEGVTAYLPTVITNRVDVIEETLREISQALVEREELAETIPGIHLEGPFISLQDGPRGAHDSAYVRAPDWHLFERWQKAAEGRIRIVTISPEWPEAVAFIERCVASGVKVSIGHTAANAVQIAAAVRAGASLSTHLGNGAHPMLPRHPNYIWDQLAADDLWACMIGDGFHLPPAVLKVIAKVKQSHALLVSDSVDLAGLNPGEYETHVGGHVVLTPEGKLHLANHPELLAGSVQSLRQGVETLLREGICSLQEAWEMASNRPAIYLGLQAAAGLSIGGLADLILFDQTETGIHVVRTIKRGQIVYEAKAPEALTNAEHRGNC